MPRGSGSVGGAGRARGPWKPECALALHGGRRCTCCCVWAEPATRQARKAQPRSRPKGRALLFLSCLLRWPWPWSTGVLWRSWRMRRPEGKEEKRSVPHERNGLVFWHCQSPGLQRCVPFRAPCSVTGVAFLEGMALEVHSGVQRTSLVSKAEGSWASLAGVVKVCQ